MPRAVKKRRARKGQASQQQGLWSRLLPWLKPVAAGTAGAMVLIAIAAAGRWITDPHTLPMRHAQVTGDFRQLSNEQVIEVLADTVTGGFFSVDVDAVQDAVAAMSWVDSVSVRRMWPDTLHVMVMEQVPVARWGDEQLLNHRGDAFAIDGRGNHQHLPRLQGPEGREEAVLTQYLRLREQLAPLGLHVEQMVQDDRRAVQVQLSNSVELKLGRSDSKTRLDRFVRAYPSLFAAREEELLRVDLRYSNGFAVEWEKPAGVTEG